MMVLPRSRSCASICCARYKGASPLTLGVALIGVAVEIAVSVGGRDGETLIREIVEDHFAAHTETEETETAH